MIEKQFGKLTPTSLRIALCLSIALLIVIAGIGFWLFRSQLTTFAEQVNKDAMAANVSASDVSSLQSLKTQLEEDSVAVTRTKNIVADSQAYQYQNQIINDLSVYAKASGVVVSGYNFTSDTAANSGTPPTLPQTPGAAVGLKSTSVSVSLKNPVDYKAVMRFIHLIEMNLTKMQLSGISLSQSPENKNLVTANPLTIEVYTR